MAPIKNSICIFLMCSVAACGGEGGGNESAPVATELQDPSQKIIGADFDFRISTESGETLIGYVVAQRAVLTNQDGQFFDIRYMTFNDREDCVLFPIEEDGLIKRFDLSENLKGDERIFEGTVGFRTGDQIQIGRVLKTSEFGQSNGQFIQYDICGRPSKLSVFTNQGIANFDIYLWGD